MDASSLLTGIGPLAAVGTLAFTVIHNRNNTRQTRRDRLIAAWNVFKNSNNYDAVITLMRAEPDTLLHQARLRAQALRVLGELDGIANSASASPTDWRVALTPEEFAKLERAVTNCRPLIEYVRQTTIPVDVPCWPDHRRKAFSQLLRAFSALRNK